MNTTAQRDLYDQRYAATDAGSILSLDQQTQIFLKWLKERMYARIGQRLSILDLGGGICSLGQRLRCAEMIDQFDYVNLDASEQAVKISRRQGFEKVVVGTIPDQGMLPFCSDHFDVVHCSHVVEHVLNPDVIFSESFRVLKPGGVLFIATPNLASWIGRVLILFGWQGYGQEISTRFGTAGKGPLGRCVFGDGGINYHLRAFTLAGLKDMMRLHGFRVTRVAGARMFDGVRAKGLGSAILAVARVVERLITPFPSLANNIMCLGEKPINPSGASGDIP